MKTDLQIFLISNQKDSREVFLNLGKDMVCKVDWRDSFLEALELIPKETQVLVVELVDEKQIELIQTWSEQNKQIPLYVITGSTELDDIRQLMKSGAKDVFVKPLKSEEIMKEMEGVIEGNENENPGGKLISFMNVKGGNGCTTMTVNTALEIAKCSELKTLLIDFDIQFGDAAAIMDIKTPNSVLEALSQSSRLDASLLTTLVTNAEHGLSVLASPDKLVDLDVVRVDDVKKLMEAAMDAYDVILVDVPRVITPWVDEVLRWSDHIFLVAQGSVSDVRDGSLIKEHLDMIGVNRDSIHFLHNRAGAKHTFASVDSDQLAKSLKTERLISIRNDYDAAIHSSDLGKAASDYASTSKLAKDIKSLAKLIIEMCGFHTEEGKAGKEENLFSKLFKKYGGGA